jgi:superfamily II DNA helicase RecQ
LGGKKRGNAAAAAVADPVNPFGDLWGPNESVASDRSSVVGGNKRRRGGADGGVGGGGANTLEKYFVGVGQPPSDAPAAVAVAVAAAAQGGAATSAREDAGTPPRSPPRRRPRDDVVMRRLRETFGIAEFRDHQGEIIDATMRGEDAFVVMRTGGGKSLTYQLPAVLECFECGGRPRKVTVVISPLVSLIRDQEEQMNRMIPGSAASFTSAMAGGTSEHARRWGMVRDPNGGVALIFVTPEKVGQSTKFKGEMEKLHNQGRLGRFVIDEW